MRLSMALERFAAGDLTRTALLASAAASLESAGEQRKLVRRWRDRQGLAPQVAEALLELLERQGEPNATRLVPVASAVAGDADRTRLIRSPAVRRHGESPPVDAVPTVLVARHRPGDPERTRLLRRAAEPESFYYNINHLDRLSDDGRRPRVGSVLKKRFRLEKVLGRGGMSVVYRALDLRKMEGGEADPYVAVKVLSDEFRLHPTALQALHREAQRAKQLVHPGVLRVYDFDRDGATAFLTMECLSGQSLKSILTAPGFAGLALARFRPLLRDMSAALNCAHRAGVIHADLKPGNVFVTEEGRAKVLDFGIARALAPPGGVSAEPAPFEAAGLSALTPAYASPEMLRGDPPDRRDDVYALGCLAYELLTGVHPFGRKDARQAVQAALAPRRIRGLGYGRWRALKKALALKRENRLGSVEALNAAFNGASLRTPLAATAALALAAALGTGWFVQVHLPAQRRTAVVAELTSHDAGRIGAARARLDALPPASQQAVLAAAREGLLDHYVIVAMKLAALRDNRPDFDAARQVLGQAAALYPDSKRLAQAYATLDSRRAKYLRDLSRRFDLALATDRIFAPGATGSSRAVDEVLAAIAAVDPNSVRLRDPRLLLAYKAHVRAALSNANRVRAGNMLAVARRRFPEDRGLRRLQARLSALDGEAVSDE